MVELVFLRAVSQLVACALNLSLNWSFSVCSELFFVCKSAIVFLKIWIVLALFDWLSSSFDTLSSKPWMVDRIWTMVLFGNSGGLFLPLVKHIVIPCSRLFWIMFLVIERDLGNYIPTKLATCKNNLLHRSCYNHYRCCSCNLIEGKNTCLIISVGVCTFKINELVKVLY